MPRYVGTPDYEHGTAERIGVLLVNLGTPDAPTARAVRRYLAEFLSDPRVIESPRWLWRLILHGVILRIRPAKSARAYAQIWTEAGSPLLIHSEAIAAAVTAELAARQGSRIEVALAMNYGNPSIAAGLESLRARHVRSLLVLPLYPQYSGTTTASVFDRVTRALGRWRWLPELEFVTQYCSEPAYIDALAAKIRAHWSGPAGPHLLFSFHGLPRRYLLAGDPYHCQCHKTARLIAERLGLAEHEWSLSFQSRVGREEWLRPYTDEILREFARQGRHEVAVVCPGFVADCLETLEEIAIRNREDFLAHGGRSLDYIPALNEDPAHIAMLADLIGRRIGAWVSEAALQSAATQPSPAQERARARGATR
jgi:ferrochelatase